jgi:hypothetical protein
MAVALPEGLTPDALLRCVDREIRMRERVYPGWVGRGKMTKENADREIAAMKGIRTVLEQALGGEQGKLFG